MKNLLVALCCLLAPLAAAATPKTKDVEVKAPRIDRGDTEVTIVRWLHQSGDYVQRDEPLFEMSTSTVHAEIPSPAAGTLRRIYAAAGQTVRADAVVAIIGDANASGATGMSETASPKGEGQGVDFRKDTTERRTVTFDLGGKDPVVDCAKAQNPTEQQLPTVLGQCWEKDIRSTFHSGTPAWARRFNVIVTDQAGGILYTTGQPYIAGNPIYVGIYSSPAYRWTTPVFDPCGLESATPEILGGTLPRAATKSLEGEEENKFSFSRFGPQACFDTDVTVKLKGTGPDPADATKTAPVTAEIKLKQYKRYRGSIQLGALYSDRHEQTFGLRQDGTNKVIFDKGEDGRSAEYVAALVLHGLPHYLRRQPGRSYEGRDPLHETDASDRLGFLLSAGLSSPKNRFGVGLAYEFVRGLNIVGAYEIVRVHELAGVHVGDQFTGAEADIPLRTVSRRGFSFGISFDPTFATALFGGN